MAAAGTSILEFLPRSIKLSQNPTKVPRDTQGLPTTPRNDSVELNFKSLGSKNLFLMKLIFEPIALVRSARSAPPGPDRTEFAHLAPDRTDRTEPTGPTGPTGLTRLDRRTGPWPGPRLFDFLIHV